MIPEPVRRVQATEATLAAYKGRAWAWEAGHTCAHLARRHLRNMGHRPERLPRLGSLLAARRALQSRGWETVADMLDAQPGLCRIAPAMMLPGDLGYRASADGLGSVVLYVDRHKLAGWSEDVEGFAILDCDISALERAWRV